jgi:hypothetical protein
MKMIGEFLPERGEAYADQLKSARIACDCTETWKEELRGIKNPHLVMVQYVRLTVAKDDYRAAVTLIDEHERKTACNVEKLSNVASRDLLILFAFVCLCFFGLYLGVYLCHNR